MKIDKIDKEVMRIGTNNGLKTEGIMLLDKTLKENILKKDGKKKPKYKIYQEVMNPNVSRQVADTKMSEKSVRNDKIAKSIVEIMESNDLTDDNLIKCHIDIRDSARKAMQYSTARSTNRDFMEIKGLLKENILNSSTTNILNLNISELEEKDIRGRLLDIIGK